MNESKTHNCIEITRNNKVLAFTWAAYDWSNDAIHQNHERAHVLTTLTRDTHTYIERLGDVVVVANVGERTTEELAGGRWVRRRLALALFEETQRRLFRLQRFLLLIFVCKKSIKTKR